MIKNSKNIQIKVNTNKQNMGNTWYIFSRVSNKNSCSESFPIPISTKNLF